MDAATALFSPSFVNVAAAAAAAAATMRTAAAKVPSFANDGDKLAETI